MDSSKKMKVTRERDESIYYNSKAPLLIMDLLFELLTRLPTKTLILKCIFVSKLWCSIIRGSLFVDAYRRRNRYCLVLPVGLMSVVDTQSRRDVDEALYCYHPSRALPELSGYLFNLLPREEVYDVTRIVNGLCCYYSRNSLFLANIFTHESMLLPKKKEEIIGAEYLAYYLGFDPVHKVYKVLCCAGKVDILTIGHDSSWRDLGYNFKITTGSLLINGVLYWIGGINYSSISHEFEICSFDFEEEKLGVTKKLIPSPSRLQWLPWEFGLVQFKGRLSLVQFMEGLSLYRQYATMIKFYILDQESGEQCTTFEFDILPYSFNRQFFWGNMPNGEVFLVECIFSLIYFYFLKNDEFVKLVVGEMPKSFYLGSLSRYEYVACIEQNIVPLDSLFRDCVTESD